MVGPLPSQGQASPPTMTSGRSARRPQLTAVGRGRGSGVDRRNMNFLLILMKILQDPRSRISAFTQKKQYSCLMILGLTHGNGRGIMKIGMSGGLSRRLAITAASLLLTLGSAAELGAQPATTGLSRRFPGFLAGGDAADAGRCRYRAQAEAGECRAIRPAAARVRSQCVADVPGAELADEQPGSAGIQSRGQLFRPAALDAVA